MSREGFAAGYLLVNMLRKNDERTYFGPEDHWHPVLVNLKISYKKVNSSNVSNTEGRSMCPLPKAAHLEGT